MRVEPFSLALSEPLSTAAGEIDRREGLLVTLERGGSRGVGEAAPLPGWTESLGACEGALRAVVDGDRDRTALDPSETPAASHAVDLARTDLAARDHDSSLARWLGDDPIDSVPVNATIGDAGVEATVQAARAAVEAGFECLKLKVGARPVEADLERVRAVRDAFHSVTLRADANGSWSRSAATTAIEGLAELSVSIVEQPVPAADLAGHADLRGRGVDVALDESLHVRGLEAILQADAADVLILKPMAIGGIRRSRELAREARSNGVSPIVTTTIDGVVARTAALHLAASLSIDRACGLATGNRLAEDLGPDPAPVEAGRMRIPDAAGIGVSLTSG